MHLFIYKYNIMNPLFVLSPQVCVEEQRFEKLMEHFRNEDNNIDFMVG
jgi:hypothetical protein